ADVDAEVAGVAVDRPASVTVVVAVAVREGDDLDPLVLDHVTVVVRAYHRDALARAAVLGDGEEQAQSQTGGTGGAGRRGDLQRAAHRAILHLFPLLRRPQGVWSRPLGIE